MKKLLALFGNDLTLVNKYVSLAKVQLPQQLARLEALIKAGNFADASAVAHAIKGQCQYLEWEDAAVLAENLERLLEDEKNTELPEQALPLATKLTATLPILLNSL